MTAPKQKTLSDILNLEMPETSIAGNMIDDEDIAAYELLKTLVMDPTSKTRKQKKVVYDEETFRSKWKELRDTVCAIAFEKKIKPWIVCCMAYGEFVRSDDDARFKMRSEKFAARMRDVEEGFSAAKLVAAGGAAAMTPDRHQRVFGLVLQEVKTVRKTAADKKAALRNKYNEDMAKVDREEVEALDKVRGNFPVPTTLELNRPLATDLEFVDKIIRARSARLIDGNTFTDTMKAVRLSLLAVARRHAWSVHDKTEFKYSEESAVREREEAFVEAAKRSHIEYEKSRAEILGVEIPPPPTDFKPPETPIKKKKDRKGSAGRAPPRPVDTPVSPRGKRG